MTYKRNTANSVVSASPAAAKKYRTWKSHTSLLTKAANCVLEKELPAITSLKLGIVLLSDEELLELNKTSLGHDYYTDILTFEIERESNHLEAEIYISMDRAQENALRYNIGLRNELAHLLIHGMLHLAGYSDKSPAAKKKMQKKEQEFLEIIK
jgi:probable rRNA maturation factor